MMAPNDELTALFFSAAVFDYTWARPLGEEGEDKEGLQDGQTQNRLPIHQCVLSFCSTAAASDDVPTVLTSVNIDCC